MRAAGAIEEKDSKFFRDRRWWWVRGPDKQRFFGEGGEFFHEFRGGEDRDFHPEDPNGRQHPRKGRRRQTVDRIQVGRGRGCLGSGLGRGGAELATRKMGEESFRRGAGWRERAGVFGEDRSRAWHPG